VLKLFPYVIGFEYDLRTKRGVGDLKLASPQFPRHLVVIEAKVLLKDRTRSNANGGESLHKLKRQIQHYAQETRKDHPDSIVLMATLTEEQGLSWINGSHLVFKELIQPRAIPSTQDSPATRESSDDVSDQSRTSSTTSFFQRTLDYLRNLFK
jgi:hypothetical protein